MKNVVLDTNCLLMSLSRQSRYYPVWQHLVKGEYILCYSNEILSEYEEILTQKMGPSIASNIISAILNLPNTRQIQVFFHLQMIVSVSAALIFIPLVYIVVQASGSIISFMTVMCLVNLPGLIVNIIQFKKLINGKAKGIWNK